MTAIEDIDSAEQSLDPNESLTVEVESVFCDDLYVFVDDGTENGTPNEYNLYQNRKTRDDNYMRHDSRTAVTDFSWHSDGIPFSFKIEVENNSGQTADFRVEALTVTESRR